MPMQTSSIAATSLGLDMPSVAGRAPTRHPFVGNSSSRDPGGQPLPRGDLGQLACRLFAEAPWLGANPDLQERDALCSPRPSRTWSPEGEARGPPPSRASSWWSARWSRLRRCVYTSALGQRLDPTGSAWVRVRRYHACKSDNRLCVVRIRDLSCAGAGAVRQRARFGTVRPRVQIPGPRPPLPVATSDCPCLAGRSPAASPLRRTGGYVRERKGSKDWLNAIGWRTAHPSRIPCATAMGIAMLLLAGSCGASPLRRQPSGLYTVTTVMMIAPGKQTLIACHLMPLPMPPIGCGGVEV